MSGQFNITGTWVLRSFVTEFDDGSQHLPYGDHPGGRITYSSDGFMSAHLWHPARHIDGTTQGDDPCYFSYCGDWSLDGDVIRHRVHAATEPSWTGQDRFRTMSVNGQLLQLIAEHVVFEGKHGRGILIWERFGRSSQSDIHEA